MTVFQPRLSLAVTGESPEEFQRNLDFKDQSQTSIVKEEAGFSLVIIVKNSTARH